jgi:hypothetical protein
MNAGTFMVGLMLFTLFLLSVVLALAIGGPHGIL